MYSAIRSLAQRGSPPKPAHETLLYFASAKARPRHLRRGAGGDSRRDLNDASRVHDFQQVQSLGAQCNGHRTMAQALGRLWPLSFLGSIECDSILGPSVGTISFLKWLGRLVLTGMLRDRRCTGADAWLVALFGQPSPLTHAQPVAMLPELSEHLVSSCNGAQVALMQHHGVSLSAILLRRTLAFSGHARSGLSSHW